MEGGTNSTCVALSQGWPGSPSPVLSPYASYPQVEAEVYSSFQSGPIQGFDEGSGGPHTENLLPQSTFPGHEGASPVPIEDPACINHTDLDATYDPCKDAVDIMPVCAIPSTTKVSRKKHAGVPSQATVQSADMQGTSKSIFPCDKCNKQYTQPQGVTRHQREAHEITSLCPICNNFRWSRPYQLTKHLKGQHPDINLDATLLKATRGRRKATKKKRHLRQQQASPPVIERDRRSRGEFLLPRSLMHTLPAVASDSHVSLTAISSVASGLEHEYADNPVTSCKREDPRELDSFDPTTNVPSASSSAEERPQPVNGRGMSVHHGQIWSSLAHTGESTPADRPSSFVTVPVSIPYSSPRVAYYGRLLLGASTFNLNLIPRDRFYGEMGSPGLWAGPNWRY